jgi:hypothetical protein
MLSLSKCNKIYDSYLNIYKENTFSPHKYDDVANSTWKELFISENVTNLIKCVPVFIDNDKELDLLVLDSESRLYWVSNIRGTSKEVKHKFISSSKLYDFVISNKVNFDYKTIKGNYILGINSKRDKILKYKMIENSMNLTDTWEETIFMDINDDSLPIRPFIKNSQVVSIHLSQYDNEENKQMLLVGLENYNDYSTNLLIVVITDEKVVNVSLIKFKHKVKFMGAYDMNNDGLIDVLYVDSYNNLYIMLNDDPYYWHLFVSNLNTVLVRGTPRLFIVDADHDGYADIITAEKIENTVGVFFNHGSKYWEDVKKFYQNSLNRAKVYSYKQWPFIPLIDVNEAGLEKEAIRDFTVFQVSSNRRINFEIFAIYENNLYWFIEKNLNVPASFDWGSHKMLQNYMYCMTKCDIVVDQQKQDDKLDYHFIIDIDINNDLYPEFIIYSGKDNCLYWIKKYVPYLSGFGWNSNFWIYICIYIYIVSSFLGMYEFYRFKRLNDQISIGKLLKTEDKHVSPDVNLFSSF